MWVEIVVIHENCGFQGAKILLLLLEVRDAFLANVCRSSVKDFLIHNIARSENDVKLLEFAYEIFVTPDIKVFHLRVNAVEATLGVILDRIEVQLVYRHERIEKLIV